MRRDSSREDDRPAFQFYPGDWLRDESLILCSLAAQGLWAHLLSRAFFSPERGVILRPNGKPATAEHIASWTGKPPEVIEACLAELLDECVASRRTDPTVWPADKLDGAIYSRRMIKDERFRKMRADAGRKGGIQTQRQIQANPKQTPKQPPSTADIVQVHGAAKACDKPDVPVLQANRKQKHPPSSSFSSSSSKQRKNRESLRAAIETLLTDWNETARVNGYRMAADIKAGTPRHAHAHARLSDSSWRDGYVEALSKLRPTPFLTGQNDRGWMADIDWFMRPGNIGKILEGGYDDRDDAQPPKISRE